MAGPSSPIWESAQTHASAPPELLRDRLHEVQVVRRVGVGPVGLEVQHPPQLAAIEDRDGQLAAHVGQLR